MTEDEIHNLSTRCPYCHRDNEAVSGGDGKYPENGAVSICWGCGNAAIFDFSQEHNMRLPTLSEKIEILVDPGMQKAKEAYRIAQTPKEAIRMMK